MKQRLKDQELIPIPRHGDSSADLVDVEPFETLEPLMEVLEGIVRGEEAIEDGRSLTHTQAKQRMSRWLE